MINLQHWIYCHAVTFKNKMFFVIFSSFVSVNSTVEGKGKKNELRYKEPLNQMFWNLVLEGATGGGLMLPPPPLVKRQKMFLNFPSNFFLFLTCLMFLLLTIVPNSQYKRRFCACVCFLICSLLVTCLMFLIFVPIPNIVSLDLKSLFKSFIFQIVLFLFSEFLYQNCPPPWLKSCVCPWVLPKSVTFSNI